MSKTPKLPECMIIGPSGADEAGQRHRRSFDMLVEKALGEKYRVIPFHEVHRAVIDAEIFEKLVKVPLVIADLTGLNPNVLYEVGIRHAFNKPIIHLHKRGEAIPFDLKSNFVIEYNAPLEIVDLEHIPSKIADRLKKISEIKDGPFNSFIASVKNTAKIDELPESPDIKNILKELIRKVDNLQSLQGVDAPSVTRALLSNRYYSNPISNSVGSLLSDNMTSDLMLGSHNDAMPISSIRY